MERVINEILEANPEIPRDIYKANFYSLYGMFWHQGDKPSKKLIQEIEYIENIRFTKCVHDGNVFYDKIERTPASLCDVYSGLAYTLALEHIKMQTDFELAELLMEIYLVLVNEYLPEDERKVRKRLISEATLDFGYASGKTKVTSFRIADIIR